jgi:hypothetical protein
MQIVPIPEFGKEGLVKDVEPILLPLSAFSDAYNVRIRNGSVGTILGEASFKTVGIAPDFGVHWSRPDGAKSVFIKGAQAVSVGPTGTLATLSTSLPQGFPWQIDKFGGGYALILNNGWSTPKYILVGDPVAGTTFQDFPGWNYAGVTVVAKVVRPLGYSLVAANFIISEGTIGSPGFSTVNAPVTVRVSVQAPVGGFPSIWEPGLTTDTADEFEINANTPIVDMAELRGSMFIYTSNSIHILSLSNGISSVRNYTKGYGALSINCITEFEGYHFVVDSNDIYIHNGSGELKSVADRKLRDYFVNNLNKTHAKKTFVVRNTRYNEIWVCFPNLTSNGTCNECLIFNYRENTWTRRVLPNVTNIFVSDIVEEGAFDFTAGKEILVGCNGTTTTFQFDKSWQMWNGTAFAAYESSVMRERLIPQDPSGDSQINSLYPILTVYDNTTTVFAHLVGNDIYDSPVDWSNSTGRDILSVNPREVKYGYKFDPRVQGRFLSYKIFASKPWKMSGINLGLFAQKNRR